MLSFFKRRSTDFKREAGTYHELQTSGEHDLKLSIPKEMEEARPAHPMQLYNPHFDIQQLPTSLTCKTKANDNTYAKISSQATGPARKPTVKLRTSKSPNPQKCESVIRQLKLILANSNSQQEPVKAASPPKANKSLPTSSSKTSGNDILMHLNNPIYASAIISMLKDEPEPHPSYAMQQGGSLEHIMPRGVCLRKSQSELEAESASANGMDDVIDVTKALTMRITPAQEVVSLITGLSAGSLMDALGASTGFYEALAIGSKTLIDRTVAHQELVGMVPKDRVSVWCYWWGFEIALPLESVDRLKTVKSIETTAIQMLVALTAAGGAVELLPFIRFISAYLDMEWGAVNEQNKGKGVVIAATWALPMALVPRAWDFDSPVVIGPLPGAGKPQGLQVLAASS